MRLWGLCAAAVTLSWSTWGHAEMMSVKVPKANFREGPSTSHAVVYTADRNYPVQVMSCKGDWCKTKDFEGDVAWVAKRLLGKRPAVVVVVDEANVRGRPSQVGRVVYKAVRAEALRVRDRKGAWVEVQDAGGTAGWIHRSMVWGMLQGGGKQ